MRAQLTMALCAVFIAGTSFAAGKNAQLESQLESVSAHIGAHTDEHAVAVSLYRQIRGHVRITRHDLKPAEIDKRVHEYIVKKYTPILLLKYSQVFKKMKNANRHFSDCRKPEPFPYSKNFDTAMCTVQSHGNIHVRYLVNEHKKGWENTSEFVFHPEHNSLRLVAIKINLRKHQKVHVDGI